MSHIIQRILIATGNRNKAREISEILGSSWVVESLADYPDIEAAEETGTTFEENAVLKALAVARSYEGVVLADDSGLEVDVLGGQPGVYSARYAGSGATDADNIAKLLAAMEAFGTDDSARCARFRCVIATAHRGQISGTFEGVVEGTIAREPRGEGGFGYDPVFVPDGFQITFAEMLPDEKHAISHRSRALAKAAVFLKESLSE